MASVATSLQRFQLDAVSAPHTDKPRSFSDPDEDSTSTVSDIQMLFGVILVNADLT